MAKTKISEIMKTYGVDKDEVASFLKEKGIEVKTVGSSVDEDTMKLVEARFGKKAAASTASAKAAASSPAPTRLNLTVPTEKGPLTLEELSVSFQTVSFRLSLPMEEGETENDLWEQVWQYLKIYPDGNDTPCGEDSTWYEKQENPDGTFRCVLVGQRRLNDGVTPERLTFDVGGARFTVSVPEMALIEKNAGA